MARLIPILLILISCSTVKKDNDLGLTVAQRDKYFAEQNHLEMLLAANDQLFLSYKPEGCVQDWTKYVTPLKDRLKKVVDDKQRYKIWFELGNCYILIGEYKKAIYYYDLVLGLNYKNKVVDSSIYFNLGQLYEMYNRDFLAYSFYQSALESRDKRHYSLLKLGMLEYKQAEFVKSNQYFQQLQRYYPGSDLVRFFIGVNYFHLEKKDQLINKVLTKLDEKSPSRVLLVMALDIAEKKNLKQLEADLRNLDLSLSLHKEFKSYLLALLER